MQAFMNPSQGDSCLEVEPYSNINLVKRTFMHISHTHKTQIFERLMSSCTSVMDLNTDIPHIRTRGNPSAPLSSPCVSSSQVKKQLERLNQNKAAAPDGVSLRLLKACAEQLCGILQHLFNLSLSQEKVPVPKKPHVSALSD